MFLKDLTANKVFIPAALFMALSPGVLLTTDGTKISYKNGKTDQMSVLVHALVFLIVYSLIAKAMGLVLTKADLIVTATLFVILSPGLLLTLPPGSGGVFGPLSARIGQVDHRVRDDLLIQVAIGIVGEQVAVISLPHSAAVVDVIHVAAAAEKAIVTALTLRPIDDRRGTEPVRDV